MVGVFDGSVDNEKNDCYWGTKPRTICLLAVVLKYESEYAEIPCAINIFRLLISSAILNSSSLTSLRYCDYVHYGKEIRKATTRIHFISHTVRKHCQHDPIGPKPRPLDRGRKQTVSYMDNNSNLPAFLPAFMVVCLLSTLGCRGLVNIVKIPHVTQ